MSNSTVVVIGGGYGGAAAAKALEDYADVILIDPRDAFVNAAGSLRSVAQPDWAENMFFSLRDLLPAGTIIQDHAASVDSGGVTLRSGDRIDADYIVLATGSNYEYPAKPKSYNTFDALEDLRQSNKEVASANRILILGAGPVGLELAGEIKEVWPSKEITVITPSRELLPGFLDEVRSDLQRQLDDLGVVVRLGTSLTTPPATEPGRAQTFTVTTDNGDELTADIWFRAFGVTLNIEYLSDGKLVALNGNGEVPVTQALNVVGHDNVYAIGDIAALGETKMAGFAMQHADVVAENIKARLRGDAPTATYTPLPHPMILLPLGPYGGVGQLPSANGPEAAPAAIVSQYKGADLFTGRFSEQFGLPR